MVRGRSYPTAEVEWGVNTQPSRRVVILATNNERIGTFPLEFIAGGGYNSWAFVLDVMRRIIVLDDELPISITHAENGAQMNLGEAPSAGVFVLSQYGQTEPVQPVYGPEYFTRLKAPNVEGSSTRSHSSRSTVRQSHFRTDVIARDGVCLLTGERHSGCDACHIVPQSRLEVYQNTIDAWIEEDTLFEASYGLLLRKDLHHRFDRLEFSFYIVGDNLYVHAFSRDVVQYHGKVIPFSCFRGLPTDRPNPHLIQWHYTQCVQARIRGYHWGQPADGS